MPETKMSVEVELPFCVADRAIMPDFHALKDTMEAFVNGFWTSAQVDEFVNDDEDIDPDSHGFVAWTVRIDAIQCLAHDVGPSQTAALVVRFGLVRPEYGVHVGFTVEGISNILCAAVSVYLASHLGLANNVVNQIRESMCACEEDGDA